MNLPPSFRQFMAQRHILVRLPWQNIFLGTSFILMILMSTSFADQQQAIANDIKNGIFMEWQLKELSNNIFMSTTLLLGFTILGFAGAAYMNFRNASSYKRALSLYDNPALVQMARSEEVDPTTRSLVIELLNKEKPGWSFA